NKRQTNLEEKPYYLKPDGKNVYLNTKPELRTDMHTKPATNSELRSYYLKPEDTGEMRKLKDDFHKEQLHFPFELYRKSAQESRATTPVRPYYMQQQHVQQFPSQSNYNGRNPVQNHDSNARFFSSSYGTPSETKLISSTVKMSQNSSEESHKNKLKNEHFDLPSNISVKELPLSENANNSTKSISENEKEIEISKFRRRNGMTNPSHPIHSDEPKTEERENQFRDSKSSLQETQNKNIVKPDQDVVKHAESQHYHHRSEDNALNDYRPQNNRNGWDNLKGSRSPCMGIRLRRTWS
ncbi:chitin-binding type-2 domain-containing protein, partial [Caerostris extrusa]